MGFLRVNEVSPNQKNAVAVGSKVSVEKKEFIATGIVSYVEGDILEIELPQYKQYLLGDEVKITVYSSNGFLIMHSSVIAKDYGFIMIINPAENQRLTQRRQHPRVNVDVKGVLTGANWKSESVEKWDRPIPIQIQNLSIGGAGFILEAECDIRAAMFLDAEFYLGTGVSCGLQVTRKHLSDEKTYVGAQFTNISKEQLTMLRGFILRNQINDRLKQRKEEQAAM